MQERLAVAGDESFGDEYLVRVLDAEAHGHDPVIHPLVQIISIIRYPAQRAVLWPDVAHEAPPLKAGLICRLGVIREAGEEDAACTDYKKSLDTCLERAIREARTDAERAILRRHAAGILKGQRAVKAYRSLCDAVPRQIAPG